MDFVQNGCECNPGRARDFSSGETALKAEKPTLRTIDLCGRANYAALMCARGIKRTILATLLFWCSIALAANTGAAPAPFASSTQDRTNASPKTAAKRADTPLFEYYIKKGLDAYIEKGKHNPKWDPAAEEAL